MSYVIDGKDEDRDRLQGRTNTWGKLHWEGVASPEIIEGLGLIHVNDSCLGKMGKKVKSSEEGIKEDLEKQITP